MSEPVKAVKRTRRKSLKINSLQDLKEIVLFLESKHVRRFVIDGVEVEFDTAVAAIHKAEQQETTHTQQKKDATGKTLNELLQEQDPEEALFWSAGK